ncbi:Cys-tRNA(Pro) deacylase [Corynebacterium sp. ES2794-CONJ1]|uniref:Cys-tRNA(Pro) deacylase n=1 Tax=unclassified Corynebacterium TaxID=2624378 RepID=UPI00216B4E31|nr:MULTISPECIES: Cys-tRNA(Pro) deacylase [unclassified Corynebacterium]MCS4531382.1 Cys-tRNA(Pro) deacylase [Corynebacterium sp. ES2730-CONJ]MCU9518769.1 Cys-tRNA(Pro) deacylase [Corynebacterium sp. ES2794-CONJ1]
MAKKKSHAATPCLQALEDAGITYTTSTFEAGNDHFGEHAVAALEVEAERVFKTLVIDLTAGKGPKRQLAVACLPVPYHLSLKKAAKAFGVPKATMADPHDASKSSGYVPGGISPIGHKNPLPTVVDETALLADSIFVSGGRRGLDVEVRPQDLATLTNASFADIQA